MNNQLPNEVTARSWRGRGTWWLRSATNWSSIIALPAGNIVNNKTKKALQVTPIDVFEDVLTPTNHSREATDSAVLEVGGALDTEALKTVKYLNSTCLQTVVDLPEPLKGHVVIHTKELGILVCG